MVIGKRTYASREVHLHCEDANILRTLVDDGNVCDVDGRGGVSLVRRRARQPWCLRYLKTAVVGDEGLNTTTTGNDEQRGGMKMGVGSKGGRW